MFSLHHFCIIQHMARIRAEHKVVKTEKIKGLWSAHIKDGHAGNEYINYHFMSILFSARIQVGHKTLNILLYVHFMFSSYTS